MSDAKAAAAARRARILAGGASRLAVAKGEAATLPGGEAEPPALSETASDVADAPASEQLPESPMAAPVRPLAARRNYVKASSAPPTPVAAGADAATTSAEGAGDGDSGGGSSSSSSSSSSSGKELGGVSVVVGGADAGDDATLQGDKTESEAVAITSVSQPAGSRAESASSETESIVSRSSRQVDEEIAKIKALEAESVEGESAGKKSVRPLAERRNRIKGVASTPEAGATSSGKSLSSSSSVTLVDSDPKVRAALAKAGLAPLQHTSVMKFIRFVAIVAVGAIVGYQSAISSAPLIKSSPLFADVPTISPILELGASLLGSVSIGKSSEKQVSLESSDDAMDRLKAFVGQKLAEGGAGLLFSPSSSSAVSASAIQAASSLGISINSSILETSVFAVAAVWFCTGMLSQFVSSRFAQKEKEKPSNIVSSIFSFLTTGLEAVRETGLGYLGELALHWFVILVVSMCVTHLTAQTSPLVPLGQIGAEGDGVVQHTSEEL